MNGLPLAIPRQLALFERIVSRLLVKLAGAIQNIGPVDLLHPVARPISSIDTETASSPTPVKVITSLTICFGKPGLLLLRSAGIHFHNHMGHDWLLCYSVSAAARYSSSLTFSSQSTTLPSSASWIATQVLQHRFAAAAAKLLVGLLRARRLAFGCATIFRGAHRRG